MTACENYFFQIDVFNIEKYNNILMLINLKFIFFLD